jgi:hypothetical protein
MYKKIQFNTNPTKLGVRRYFIWLIHKVIHRKCEQLHIGFICKINTPFDKVTHLNKAVLTIKKAWLRKHQEVEFKEYEITLYG